MSQKAFIERRKHRRYQVEEGAFTINAAKSGLIANISMGGMTFHYIDRKAWADEKTSAVDILFDEHDFYLDGISCESVADCTEPSTCPDKAKVVKRHSIMFKNLTPQQKDQLKFFIEHFTKESLADHSANRTSTAGD